MAWPFTGVLNACITILLLIGGGWMAKWKGLIGDRFLPEVNSYLLLAAFPCLVVSYMGITIDLRDGDGWKAMAAYLLWIAAVQIGVSVYGILFCKGDIGTMAILNMQLTANNTWIIGLPVMEATFGTVGRLVALLTGVPLFLSVLPYSIILLEVEQALGLHKSAEAPPSPLAGIGGGAAPGHALAASLSRAPALETVSAPPGRLPRTADASTAPTAEATAEAVMVEGTDATADVTPKRGELRAMAEVSSASEGRCNGHLGQQDAAATVAVLGLPSTQPPGPGAQDGHSAALPYVCIELAADDGAAGSGEASGRVDTPTQAGAVRSSKDQRPLPLAKLHKTSSFSQAWAKYVLAARRRGAERARKRRNSTPVVDGPIAVPTTVELGRRSRRTQPPGRHRHDDDSYDDGSDSDADDRQWAAYAAAASLARSVSQRTAALSSSMRRFVSHTTHILPAEPAAAAGQQQLSKASADPAGAGGVPDSDHKALRVLRAVLETFKNPMLWSLGVAIIVSVSGLRKWLDASSPEYVIGTGWILKALQMLGGTGVPLALFSSGVFLHGKQVWKGNSKKAAVIVAIKVFVLPWLQLLFCKLLALNTATAMSLVLLSVCPCASTSFALAVKYNRGAEEIILVTLVQTLLLIPIILAALNIPLALKLYDFDSSALPLP